MSPIRFRIAAILSATLVLLAASYWLLPAPAPIDAKSVLAASVSAAIEKSAHIRRHARPTYEAEVLGELGANANNGSYYRFDDQLSAASVRDAPQSLDGSDSSLLFSLEFDADELPNHDGQADLEDGSLVLQELDRPFEITSAVRRTVPRDEVGEFTIRASATQGTQMKLLWVKEGGSRWNSKISVDLIHDGRFHNYTIDAKNVLKRGLKAGDNLGAIRLVVSSTTPDSTARIDYVRLHSKLARYQRKLHGVDYETMGKEMRRVLYMSPAQTLDFSLEIPIASPTMDFGTAVLLDDEPVQFEVELTHQGQVAKLYSGSLEASEAWTDVRLPLSAWAGEKVSIALRVRGSARNIAFWSNPTVKSEPKRRLDIIVILEDSQRADHLSVYGYPRDTTPYRQRLLAQSGAVFLKSISQATKTRPSVPSLMTSLLPTATGVIGWSNILNDAYLTLAEVLRSQGFTTASFVQNGNAGPYVGLHQGYSYLFDAETLTNKTPALYGEPLNTWMERHRDENTFLYLHAVDPHGKYDPPAPHDAWYHERGDSGTPVKRRRDLDPGWVKQPTVDGRRRRYDGEIRHNDEQLAKFLSRSIGKEGLRDTLLIFISDHGEYLGERGMWEHHPPGYIQAIGVPFMIAYPRRFPEPQRIPETVQLMDLMPTILELAGVDATDLLLQGDSLVDLIDGNRPSYWKNRLSVSEEPLAMSGHEPCGCGSVFFRNLHGLRSSAVRSGRRIEPEVFDFWKDPTETTKLSMSYLAAEIEPALTEIQENNIAAWHRWTGGEVEDYRTDPDVIERLRGLGYLHE